MPFYITVANMLTGVGTIVGMVLLVLGIVIVYLAKDTQVQSLISRHAMFIAWLIAAAAVVGSLFYSEIAHFEPCKLCWLQRIFIYPQVVLLGIALWRKDTTIRLYCLALAIIGLVVAIDQVILQFTGVSFIPCAATAVSCSKVYVNEFGFVTIPVMSFTLYTLFIFLVLQIPHQQ